MNSPFTKGQPYLWDENRHEIRDIPHKWAIYRFVQRKSNAIDYIGITSDLYSRLANHRSTKKYYRSDLHVVRYQLAIEGVSWDEMRDWEVLKIRQRNPNLVTYIGGNGKRPAVQINGEVIEPEHGETIGDLLEEMGYNTTDLYD